MKAVIRSRALFILSTLTIVAGCVSPSTEDDLGTLQIYGSPQNTEKEHIARLKRIQEEEKANAAKYCDTEELESSASKAVANEFPDRDFEGKLSFSYRVSSDVIAITVSETSDYRQGQAALRVTIFNVDDCQLQSVLIPQ
jgi:GH24 family phage-related lysozyme (muramidase)